MVICCSMGILAIIITNMNKTLVVGSVLLVLAAAGYVGLAQQAQPAAPEPTPGTPVPTQQEPQGSAMPVPTPEGAGVVEKVANPTSAATQPEPEPAGPSYFTAADVATHNQYTDCWISVQGSVFDMTGFDSIHPGGREAIMKLCGKDGTRAFGKEDEHEERGAWQEIQQFKVGLLRG